MDCPSAVPDEGTEGGGNGEGDAEGKVERSRGLPASMLNIRRKMRKCLRNLHEIDKTCKNFKK